MALPQIKKLPMNIIVGVALFLVVVAGYWIFVKKPSSVTSVPGGVSFEEGAMEAVAIGDEVSQTLKELDGLNRAVSNSVAVFEAPKFKSLKNFTFEVPVEPVGRENPFISTDRKIETDKVFKVELIAL